jgi:hypothetical protein
MCVSSVSETVGLESSGRGAMDRQLAFKIGLEPRAGSLRIMHGMQLPG